MQKFIQIELWENLQKHPWDKMTTHLTSGIISALITTLGGVPWNRLWDGDSQAEGLCSVINNLVERRKQNRLSKGDTWTVDTVSLLTGFHKKSSPDLPELDALPSYFPWGIRVCLYPHPHWPGFRNKLPRTGVPVILGQAALISWGNSWGLTFPTVGEMPASDVKRVSGVTLQHLPQSITHATQIHLCEYNKFCVQLSHDSIWPLFLWKLTKVSGISNRTATAGGLKATAEHHSLVCHLKEHNLLQSILFFSFFFFSWQLPLAKCHALEKIARFIHYYQPQYSEQKRLFGLCTNHLFWQGNIFNVIKCI